MHLLHSVLSLSLMKDMSVQSHVLADRSGNQVLVGAAGIQIVNGTTQVRNTSTAVKVTKQAMQVDGLKAARRLESTDTTNTKQQFDCKDQNASHLKKQGANDSMNRLYCYLMSHRDQEEHERNLLTPLVDLGSVRTLQ